MEELPGNSDANETGVVAVVVDSIRAFLGSAPTALRKNVVKAFSHLLKIPNAYIDGVSDEIKATSSARVKLITATGKKLAEAVEVDRSLAEAATNTFAQKIIRQQKNAIKVIEFAAEEIEKSSSKTIEDEPKDIGEDWLNAFEAEAINMSSEEMQRIFGKILAGEIVKPASYSIRTIKLIGQMDTEIAKTFKAFCSMCVTYVASKGEIVDARVLTFGSEANYGLNKFGMPWTAVALLAEYGLLSDADPRQVPYALALFDATMPKKTQLPIKYADKFYVLVPIAPKTLDDFPSFQEYGLALSRAGRELFNIVEIEENKKYTEELITYFNGKGLWLHQSPAFDKLAEQLKNL